MLIQGQIHHQPSVLSRKSQTLNDQNHQTNRRQPIPWTTRSSKIIQKDSPILIHYQNEIRHFQRNHYMYDPAHAQVN